MCGIAGSAGSPREAAEAEVRAMLARLAHRGPGDRVVLSRDGLALGTARLHVVSPTAPSGPYVTKDGAVAASVNGEIWNHAELRASLEGRGVAVPEGADTAVVAPLYAAEGFAGLARLRGMFAAAVHDARDGSVVLFRDRFGIKPLHWTPGPPFRFASEPAALGTSRAIDRSALADWLVLGTVPAPATLDPFVRQVRPGTAVVLREGRAEERRFAGPPAVAPGASLGPEELRAALERAVERHLAGDLPVAVLLSGGVDSAAIAALVARTGRPLVTVTCAIPSASLFDEHREALWTAGHLDARAVVVALTPDDVPELLDAVLRAHGFPFADASAVATHHLCRAAARVAGVVLSGTGADELLCGYRRYALSGAGLALARAARVAAPLFRGSRLGSRGETAFESRLRKAARTARSDPPERCLEALAVFPARWRRRLLGSAEPPPVLDRFRAAFASSADFADGARAADYGIYLPDDVLAKEDRAAAAVSLENRVPFLDDEVADLAGRVPAAALGVRLFRRTKPVLRAAVADLLPPDVLRRPKKGFAVPVSPWLRGPLGAWTRDLLGGPDARVREHLDSYAVAELLAAHLRGDDDLGSAVWALVVLETWLRRRGQP